MFVAELRYFLECLEHGVVPQPGLEEGMAATRLAQVLGDGGVFGPATIPGALPANRAQSWRKE